MICELSRDQFSILKRCALYDFLTQLFPNATLCPDDMF